MEQMEKRLMESKKESERLANKVNELLTCIEHRGILIGPCPLDNSKFCHTAGEGGPNLFNELGTVTDIAPVQTPVAFSPMTLDGHKNKTGKTPITLFKTPAMTVTQIKNKSKNDVAIVTGDTVTTENAKKNKTST